MNVPSTFYKNRVLFFLFTVCMTKVLTVCAMNPGDNPYRAYDAHKRFEFQYRNPAVSDSYLIVGNAVGSIVGAYGAAAIKSLYLNGVMSCSRPVAILIAAGLYGAAYGYYLCSAPDPNNLLGSFIVNSGNMLGGFVLGYVLQGT